MQPLLITPYSWNGMPFGAPIVGHLNRESARRWVVCRDGSEWDLPDTPVHYRALPQQEVAERPASPPPPEEPQAPPPGHPDETPELKAARANMAAIQGAIRKARMEATTSATPEPADESTAPDPLADTTPAPLTCAATAPIEIIPPPPAPPRSRKRKRSPR